MPDGTDFTYDEFIPRKFFENKAQIEYYIEELEEELNDYKVRLMVYAVSDPENLVELDDDRSITDAIVYTMEDVLEWYDETLLKLYRSRKYLEIYTEK